MYRLVFSSFPLGTLASPCLSCSVHLPAECLGHPSSILIVLGSMRVPGLSDRLTEHTCLQDVFLIKSLIGYFCSLEEAGTEHAEQVEKQQQRLKPKNILWGIRAIA